MSLKLVSSVNASKGEGSVGRKSRENLPGDGMRLFVKYEGDAWRNVSVLPVTHTERNTDELVLTKY